MALCDLVDDVHFASPAVYATLALIVGIVVGTYSSVFTAAPVAVALEGTGSKSRPEPPATARHDARRTERVEAEPQRSAPAPALSPATRSPGGMAPRPGPSRRKKGNRPR